MLNYFFKTPTPDANSSDNALSPKPAPEENQIDKDSLTARIVRPELTDENRAQILEFSEVLKKEPILQQNSAELEQFLTEESLHRYLRARRFDIQAAKDMIMKSFTWYLESRPDLLNPYELRNEIISGLVKCPGVDQHGRPIIILDPCQPFFSSPPSSTPPPVNQIGSSPNVAQFSGSTSSFAVGGRTPSSVKLSSPKSQLLLFTLERATQLLKAPVEKFLIFIPLQRVELSSIQSSSLPLPLISETLVTMMNHFPERLGHCILFQAGWFFSSLIWKPISLLLEPVTRSKVIFINGDYADGSDNDKLLKNLIGDDWKQKTGLVPTPAVSTTTSTESAAPPSSEQTAEVPVPAPTPDSQSSTNPPPEEKKQEEKKQEEKKQEEKKQEIRPEDQIYFDLVIQDWGKYSKSSGDQSQAPNQSESTDTNSITDPNPSTESSQN